ncbi:hypothetical protein [Streptomyces sp. NPDC006459]|uniref:hypothetical protein n=1 Tax=Streptomyces sp. NPDC006459 TaxID=3154303 RepID=UPI0033B97274
MHILGKVQGRHVKRKSVLAVAAGLAAAAAAGGLQLTAATSSPAATAGYTVRELRDWVAPDADGSVYYGFASNVSSETKAMVEEAAKAWNERLGKNLLRPAKTKKPQVNVSVESFEVLIKESGYEVNSAARPIGVGGPDGGLMLSREMFQSGNEPDEYTRKRLMHTVVHEFGHVLGLDHPNVISSCDDIMRWPEATYQTPDGKPCENSPGTNSRPSADEAAAVKAHYEPGAKTPSQTSNETMVKNATEILKKGGKSEAEARAELAGYAKEFKISMEEAAAWVLANLAKTAGSTPAPIVPGVETGDDTKAETQDSEIVQKAIKKLMDLTGNTRAQARAQIVADAAQYYNGSMDVAAQQIMSLR